jgi:hypothetical protein
MSKKQTMFSVEQKLKGFEQCEHHADVCVVGGGLAGLCAAERKRS